MPGIDPYAKHNRVVPPFIILLYWQVHVYYSIDEVPTYVEIQDVEGMSWVGYDSIGNSLRPIAKSQEGFVTVVVDETAMDEIMTSEDIKFGLIEFFSVRNPKLGLTEEELTPWSNRELLDRLFKVIVEQADSPDKYR